MKEQKHTCRMKWSPAIMTNSIPQLWLCVKQKIHNVSGTFPSL